jgi:hypothetical protein
MVASADIDVFISYRHSVTPQGAIGGKLFLVNFKYSAIFNRVFEKQKSTRNEKKNAKIRAI